MLLAVFLFAALDGTAKLLVNDYSVFQITWGRYVSNLLLMAIFLPGRGLFGLLKTTRLGFQLGRGLLLLISTASVFEALRFLPMADTYAITFVSPLFVAILSVPLLKETVDRQRWLAILCGFAGVIVVMRPGSGAISWAVIFPLTMASAYALYQVLTGLLSGTENAITTLFYTALVGSSVMSMAMPFVWIRPTFAAWGLMAAMGLIGLLGQLLLFKAFALAPASLISPVAYSQIVWATLFGYVVFSDVPDAPTIVGSLIVIGSGLFLMWGSGSLRAPGEPQ